MSFTDSIDFISNNGVILLMHNISCADNLGSGLDDLSSREKMRYKKIKDSQQKTLYLKQRIILREFLSAALVCDISEIKYRYKNNKPKLVSYVVSDFNISHSADTFAVCVLHSGKCGIDVDFQRDLKYAAKISQRFFTIEEQEYISSHADSEYAFFEIWSKKEAVIKMHGTGMFADAKNYNVFDAECYNIRLENGFLSFACTEHLENLQFIEHDFASGNSISSFF